MQYDETLAHILTFLVSIPGWRGEVAADTPILETGQLDSLGIVSLTAFIQESLGVEIPEERFRFESFATPRSIADLVCGSESGPVTV